MASLVPLFFVATGFFESLNLAELLGACALPLHLLPLMPMERKLFMALGYNTEAALYSNEEQSDPHGLFG